MDARTAELRDLFADKQALEEKRKKIKEKALAHRDDVAGAKQAKSEIEEIDRQLREVDEKIKNKKSEDTKTMNNELLRGENTEEMERRAAAFAASGKMTITNSETRSVLLSGGKIATPTGVSGINDAFNKVSSIVDQVKVVDCTGMGSNKVAFEKNIATADSTAEGSNYNESDPEFDFKTITPDTITVISYISKQVQKQSPLMYEAKVRDSALKALRKKAGSIIVSKIVASDQTVDISTGVTAIDATALRKIAMNYGGDENVVGNAVLYLNKKDLIKFGDIRGTNEKKAVYEITPDTANPNTGIIRDGGLSVAYCINSSLAEGTMVYGQPMNCELDLFSDYEIAVSEDFKFNQGLLAIRGDVQLGADVVAAEGFVKVVIAAG